uniref:Aspartic proteinase nepenthesin-1 n=1 Tax=Rhizophora mucronata TaxID=61149 RepID=A0A2P2ILT7_RHIMU
MKRHRWDPNAGLSGEIIARVEQRDGTRGLQVPSQTHERVPQQVIGFSLQPSHCCTAVHNNPSVSGPVEPKHGLRNREQPASDAHSGEFNVVKGVYFWVS